MKIAICGSIVFTEKMLGISANQSKKKSLQFLIKARAPYASIGIQ